MFLIKCIWSGKNHRIRDSLSMCLRKKVKCTRVSLELWNVRKFVLMLWKWQTKHKLSLLSPSYKLKLKKYSILGIFIIVFI